ncbi:hypothetical protein [Rubritalea tangerina]|uniref:Uncharacterized protein n=1 Tax=Rubritalea tangerina TaxID=430798 RepID=A0ABW4ZCU8_9BACT
MAKSSYSKLDIVGIILAMLFLLGLALWFTQYAQKHTGFVTSAAYLSSVPAEGKHIHVDSIESYWIKRNGKVYPAAKITISPQSSTGALRTFFRSNVGDTPKPSKVVGDSNTLRVKDGKFSNDSHTIEVVCTKGLESEADFLAYRNQDDYRWVIELREAKEGSRSASDFNSLAQAPISPLILSPAEK